MQSAFRRATDDQCEPAWLATSIVWRMKGCRYEGS